ncbi:Hsp20/alpha crystallin family protein [Simplicispira hankyongi]|uniref:Hsp20/alpha crystallin family protein n=1 Tax=Simplicispira hankyongi TaxID=2315688 RepID=A0A398C696_9BURK|nr:Hsp20/alpha crystallin family protein [Simplicispira hankyongi]RID98585.1 Hsp20/alpha crystallin family protein [Simplicispira hankyongi]
MNELLPLDPFAIDPFDDALRSFMRPWRVEMPEAAPRIKLDLSEQDGSYAVKAEIPGVKKDDIDVRIDGSMVTISAEIKSEKEEKGNGGRMLRRERQEGYASRSFSLACPVDESKVEASYKDGILTLTLPKKADSSSKRIAIA